MISIQKYKTRVILFAILSWCTMHVYTMLLSYDLQGLYCQYAAVGLIYGTAGSLSPFCNYVFKGQGNLCANGQNIGKSYQAEKAVFSLCHNTIPICQYVSFRRMELQDFL